jgi:hypothetical protein
MLYQIIPAAKRLLRSSGLFDPQDAPSLHLRADGSEASVLDRALC